MTYEYDVPSWFRTRMFLLPYVDSDTIPSSAGAADEITSIIDHDLGKFEKDYKEYRTLGGNGWQSMASLGQSQSQAQLNLIREGYGDVYVGTDGSTTYTRLRNWCMNSNRVGQSSSRCIIEVIPRDAAGTLWEGTCYFVKPGPWDPGRRDTESGMEYNVSVRPFGPPIPLNVTYNSSTDTFSFTAASQPAVTGVTVNGESTVTIGETTKMTAAVTPAGASGEVAWSVTNGTGEASISGTGILIGLSAGTVTVKATSVADPSVSGTKSVTVSAG